MYYLIKCSLQNYPSPFIARRIIVRFFYLNEFILYKNVHNEVEKIGKDCVCGMLIQMAFVFIRIKISECNCKTISIII